MNQALPSRDELGKLVRDEWVKWAGTLEKPKPRWLVPWEDLDEEIKEVDRCIGRRFYDLFSGMNESL